MWYGEVWYCEMAVRFVLRQMYHVMNQKQVNIRLAHMLTMNSVIAGSGHTYLVWSGDAVSTIVK